MPSRNGGMPGVKRIPTAVGWRWCWAASQLSRRAHGYSPRTELLWSGAGEPTDAEKAVIAKRCQELANDLAEWLAAIDPAAHPGPGRRNRKPVAVEGTVYFLRSGDRIKIGFSAAPRLRLRDLQTGNPEELVPVGWMRGDVALEESLHVRFERLRVRGEWFRATPALLRFIGRVTPPGESTAPLFRALPEPADGPENFA